jgi:glycosyltransferase involved in cell wall biosynthesis
MRVLHIALYDHVGGACIGAYRQHKALRKMGVDSNMWVRFKTTNDANVIGFQASNKLLPRMSRVLLRRWYEHQWKQAGKRGEMFDVRSEFKQIDLKPILEADVVNFQFPWNFLGFSPILRLIPNDKPVVVTMRSMEYFTGGCSYTGNCQRFREQCGECPILETRGPNDLSHKGWGYRKQIYDRKNSNIKFVAVSKWLAGEAERSSLLSGVDIPAIYIGIDTELFRPMDKASLRAGFGIGKEQKVIGFASASVSDPRKGVPYLLKSLNGIHPKPLLLTCGKSELSHSGCENIHLGHIDNEKMMALFYNLCDVFVVPSLEENLPKTAVEALACGVPVVGFAAGGIPEIVRHEKTGLLCPVGDTETLRTNIERLLVDEGLWRHCSENGPRVVREEFSYEVNSRNYIALYQSLLDKSQSAS